MNKTKKIKLTTPFGIAGYCALIRPSTKFNPDGDYSARIILPEGPDTDAFIAELDALYEEAYQRNLAEAKADKPKLTDIKRADKPYKRPVDDDTGEELTGWQLNSRLKAIRRDKNGTIVGESSPTTVDSKNKSVHQEVGSGSVIRVQFMPQGFFTAALGSGLTLRLVGVQVKDLVPVGGAKAEFEELPDGFVETVKASDPVEVIHAPESGDALTAEGSPAEVDW